MRRAKWFIIIGTLLIVLVIAGKFLIFPGHKENKGPGTVQVKRGTIVDKALAVGNIEPVSQISVKSKMSGVVKKLYADEGQLVHKGDPLLKVQPEPTPLDLAETKRQVDLIQIKMNQLKLNLNRQEYLEKKGLVSKKNLEAARSAFEESNIRYKIASDKLALIETGKIRIANKLIETIIRAPISGSVLERDIELGDPVVPLTSYQEGTVLMRLANMNDLVFKGTVDEIDVGKLREGMKATIQIGALPGVSLDGKVTKISLKAKKRENATVFPVEIALTITKKEMLRAGYSANATIIIQERKDVLVIPERVITFRDGKSFVRVKGANGKPVEKEIQVGLSNAMNIEITAGLKKGEVVFEKPVKKIE